MISHLENVPELDTINLSNNLIKNLEGLATCTKVPILTATMLLCRTMHCSRMAVACK